MKKQLLLLVMMLLPMVANADAVEIDGIYYELITKTKEAKVVKHPKKYKNDIVIPGFVSYNGIDYNVSSIDHGAFSYCFNLTSVSIPSSVNSIGDHAFDDCFNLSSIVIPSSVISIGREAFVYCSGLTSITIPKSVTSIGDYAFERCSKLESIIVESGNLNYDSRDECNAIIEKSSNRLTCGCMNTIIPSSVEIIGVLAFADCTSLKTINIPSGVKTIEDNAFDGCTGLNSLNFNDGLTSIGGAAFRGCESLSSITIPNSVRTIIDYAFTGCSNITTIKIGKEIEKIGSGAFSNCKELTDVYCYAHNVPENICLSLNSSNYGKLCTDAFEGSLIEYATLHVPARLINAYKVADPWKNFKSVVKIDMPKHKLIYMVDDEVYKSYEIEEGETISPEPTPTKEGYTFSGWSSIPETMPAHDVTVIGTFTINKYKLTYTVDGNVYKTYDIEYGAKITPESAPSKEGYSFSGWSAIPTTMPAKDVTVTGTFTINKYKLIYKVDGVEYKTYEIEYGASITPEAEPKKEGYTFSGWSWIPNKMPSEDVTVTGTFTINKYKLTYFVDGAEYKSYEIEYGASITPEAEPTKEGYTFSGWSSIPETMPAKDVTVIGTFTKGAYKLTYMVDGEVYKTVTYDYGATITPEAAPTKEGYTFSGWSEIPSTMPAKDLTVKGSFTINKYKLTYFVDGEEYKSYEIEYGASITPEAEPTKEGYTFSGWSSIPKTMPANDVTVSGTFSKGSFKLIYMIDGVVYKTISYDYGDAITPEPAPTKEGYTFSGWSDIPQTMPANDVTVTGTFTVNKYKLTYMIDGEVYKTFEVEYGATITPEPAPEIEGYEFSGWSEIPETMPAHDVTVIGSLTVGIADVLINSGEAKIFDMKGNQIGKLQKGINIIVYKDGKTKKVVMK